MLEKHYRIIVFGLSANVMSELKETESEKAVTLALRDYIFSLPCEVALLRLLAAARIATVEQFCKSDVSRNMDEVWIATKALLDEGYTGEIKDYKIKKGTNKGIETVVYYLTDKGKEYFEKYLPEEAAFAQTGKPDISERRLFPYHLLVAEIYAHTQSTGTILKAENANSIKNAFLAEGHRTGKNRYILQIELEQLASLRITSYSEYDEDITTKSFAAGVNMSARQIKEKLGELVWFAYDDKDAGIIRRAVGEEAIVIEDEDEILKEADIYVGALQRAERAARRRIKRDANITDEKILNIIESAGGAATKDLLKTFLNSKETKTTEMLENLAAAGKLVKLAGALCPGTSRGRNLSIFALPENELNDDFAGKQVLRSYALTLLHARGFLYFRNWSGRYIEVARQPDFKVRSVLFTDRDEVKPNQHLIEQNINLYAEWCDENSEEIFYACSEEWFEEYLMELNKTLTLTVLNFNSAAQAHSYRYKGELKYEKLGAGVYRLTAEYIAGYQERARLGLYG